MSEKAAPDRAAAHSEGEGRARAYLSSNPVGPNSNDSKRLVRLAQASPLVASPKRPERKRPSSCAIRQLNLGPMPKAQSPSQQFRYSHATDAQNIFIDDCPLFLIFSETSTLFLKSTYLRPPATSLRAYLRLCSRSRPCLCVSLVFLDAFMKRRA